MIMEWQHFLENYKETPVPDPWEFLRFICISLDEQKVELPILKAPALGGSPKEKI